MFKEIAELFRSLLAPFSSDSSSANTQKEPDPPAPSVPGMKSGSERPRSERGSSQAAGKARGTGQKASPAAGKARGTGQKASPAAGGARGTGQKASPAAGKSRASGQGLIRAADQFAASLTRDHFLRQQAQMADLEGSPCAYVPFNVQMPVYSSLHPSQKSYYFYWRSRFRKGLYEKTDSGYIRLLCFEIMSGTGWTEPEEGLAMLGTLLSQYGNLFPILNTSLCLWYRDFAVRHRLPLREFPTGADPADTANGLLNIYLCSLDTRSPLKLPYEVLAALIDYPLSRSRFWQAGNDRLMMEALPRCTGLADQILRRKTGKGILETYMPADVSVLMLHLYAGAVAEDAGRTIKVTVRNYQAAAPLRDYLTNLARHCENCLRTIMKYRGRLRDIRLDRETADIVSAFLKREYDPAARKRQETAGSVDTNADRTSASAQMRLDFEKIRHLRIQSDHVRDLLQVNEEDVPDEIRQETDLTVREEEIPPKTPAEDPFRTVSEREFYEIMTDTDNPAGRSPAGTSDPDAADSVIADSVTGLNGADPDVADLVAAGAAAVDQNTAAPDPDTDPDVAALWAALTGLQREALGIILQGSDTAERLRVLAADRLCLPEQLIDELNEKSMEFLGDIIIESTGDSFEITEEYLASIQLCYAHSPASGS